MFACPNCSTCAIYDLTARSYICPQCALVVSQSSLVSTPQNPAATTLQSHQPSPTLRRRCRQILSRLPSQPGANHRLDRLLQISHSLPRHTKRRGRNTPINLPLALATHAAHTPLSLAHIAHAAHTDIRSARDARNSLPARQTITSNSFTHRYVDHLRPFCQDTTTTPFGHDVLQICHNIISNVHLCTLKPVSAAAVTVLALRAVRFRKGLNPVAHTHLLQLLAGHELLNIRSLLTHYSRIQRHIFPILRTSAPAICAAPHDVYRYLHLLPNPGPDSTQSPPQVYTSPTVVTSQRPQNIQFDDNDDIAEHEINSLIRTPSQVLAQCFLTAIAEKRSKPSKK